MSTSNSRVILITGASAGIGRSCAIALSEAFPSSIDPQPLVLILSGRRKAELEATAKACKQGTTTEICVGDVSKDEDVLAMFSVVKEKYGRLDLLFNVSPPPGDLAWRYLMSVCLGGMQNAGVDLLNSVPLEEADMCTFRQILEVNIMAAVMVSAQMIPCLQACRDPVCTARLTRSWILVHQSSHRAHERPIPKGRPHHQQRQYLRQCPPPK